MAVTTSMVSARATRVTRGPSSKAARKNRPAVRAARSPAVRSFFLVVLHVVNRNLLALCYSLSFSPDIWSRLLVSRCEHGIDIYNM